jgi:hypothetical protein
MKKMNKGHIRNNYEKLKNYERFKKLVFEGWIRFHAERAKKGYAKATRKYYAQAKKEK